MPRTLALGLAAWLLLSACTGDSDPIQPATSVELARSGTNDCVERYGLDTLRNRAFAFDGIVKVIEPATNSDPEDVSYPQVTLEVGEWFRASGPDVVTVSMNLPWETRDGTPDYSVGSRLLLSGEARWGGDPLDEPIVWSCGFSRTYDVDTATAWREALQ